MRYLIFAMCLVVGGVCASPKVEAHEMIPAYPELETSFMPGVRQVDLLLFNRRVDVQYYEISVWDGNWKSVPFAAENRIFKVKYLERKAFTVYIRDKDVLRVKYICTRSKLLKGGGPSRVSSKICSKIK
jgi:hypothetical protein